MRTITATKYYVLRQKTGTLYCREYPHGSASAFGGYATQKAAESAALLLALRNNWHGELSVVVADGPWVWSDILKDFFCSDWRPA